MPEQPLIPRSRTNPVGQTKRMARAKKATNNQLRRIEKQLLRELDRIPTEIQNGRLLMNQFYEYQISLSALERIVAVLTQNLQNVGQDVLAEMVRQAYREGTGKAVENLARISDDYSRSITDVLRSQPFTRRAALAAARVFELMKGFSADTAADLARILFQAVQDGVNPRVVARDISARFGIHRRRAERISRTEITMSLRRGRWDEAKDAEDRFGFEIRLIHYSALIPGRTRATHAERHGRIVTRDQQAEWYAQDGNGINCLCSSTEITIENGRPVQGQKLLERLAEQRKAFGG